MIKVVIAAGGTGGHLFPAKEVANALAKLGAEVHLVTDKRGLRYAKGFAHIHTIAGGQWSGRGIFRRIWTLCLLGFGCLKSLWIVLRLRPAAVIGMGGYISVPPVIAGWVLRRRTVIFNADAVMGNANILLKRFASTVCVAFEGTVGAPVTAVTVGFPLRREIVALTPKQVRGDKFVIAIMGGSQGNSIFGENIPKAVALLPAALRRGLCVYQQAMEPAAVRTLYKKLGVKATVEPFFADAPKILASASLFIGLGGANTVYEIGFLGIPAIFIPLEHKDQQQALNAGKIADARGAVMIRRADFTPELLAAELARLLGDKKVLEKMREKAKIFTKTNNAAKRIAVLALRGEEGNYV